MRKLSRREKEVYNLLAKGLMNKQIAIDLDLSQSTISEYRRRVLEKLGLRSNYEIFQREMQEKQNDKTRNEDVWFGFRP